jgi:holo-[acyl-carrier protein] synthase
VILGLGNDVVKISRIETSIERFGQRFLDRIFTEGEQARARGRPLKAAAGVLAKRFAAKEACAKALGTGFAEGVFWRDIEVVNMKGGRPFLRLAGGAAARLDSMTPPGMRAVLFLSMSDDDPVATAVVTISAEPSRPAP